MIKCAKQKEIEKRAREIANSDKRLSWSTCKKKAIQGMRLFGSDN